MLERAPAPCLFVTAVLVRFVEALGHGKLGSVSDLHPTARQEPDRLRPWGDPECRVWGTGVRNGLALVRDYQLLRREHYHHPRCHGAEDSHDRARARLPCVQWFRQLALRAGLDCQTPSEALSSHHATFCNRYVFHHLVGRFLRHSSDAGNDRRGDSVANVDLSGNSPAGTSIRYCQTRCRKRTRPARDATNSAFSGTGCAGTMPSSCCNIPNDRSDTVPSPTARNQPTSNRKADTTSNDRSDTEPSRCRR